MSNKPQKIKGSEPILDFYRTRKRTKGGKWRVECSWRLLAAHNRENLDGPGESFVTLRGAKDNARRVCRDHQRAVWREPATQ